jgi:hypothetical protein
MALRKMSTWDLEYAVPDMVERFVPGGQHSTFQYGDDQGASWALAEARALEYCQENFFSNDERQQFLAAVQHAFNLCWED